MKVCFLHHRIFINSLLSFYKENKITEHVIPLNILWDWRLQGY